MDSPLEGLVNIKLKIIFAFNMRMNHLSLLTTVVSLVSVVNGYVCQSSASSPFSFCSTFYTTTSDNGVSLSCVPQGGAISTCYSVPVDGYYLAMQDDGNLVMYSTSNSAIYSTETGGQGDGPHNFRFQTDGNAVVYSPSGTALFATNTGGQGITGGLFCAQSDGNVVLYDSSMTARWASGTGNGGGGGGSGPTSLTSDQQNALNVHNSARAAVGSPALTWDTNLQAEAQSWANYLASLDNGLQDQSGENTFSEWNSNLQYDTPLTDGANAWYSEIAYYSYTECCTSGSDGQETGHYSKDSASDSCVLNT
ncbi:hypothetical protein HK100_004668, partial [Physocladia obscura]